MNSLRPASSHLDGLAAYDPKFMPAQAYLSANENPNDISISLWKTIVKRMEALPFNRYPDPLANAFREVIAEANELDRSEILIGNGGDELLFNLALAWGGPDRSFLNLPPTFSVYAHNAALTGTRVIDIPRKADFSIDEEAVLSRVGKGDIDFMIITSPNNPTGNLADASFIVELLESSDTLIIVDEAYGEFSSVSMRDHLPDHKNLVLLRTLSKAYCLAGVRIGYIMAHEEVINELIKVRQPYSVDAVSQVIGMTVYEQRASFESLIADIIAERDALYEKLNEIPAVSAYPSAANYILFKVDEADEVWHKLYEQGVLVRNFSSTPGLSDCLRVSVGSNEENNLFIAALTHILEDKESKA